MCSRGFQIQRGVSVDSTAIEKRHRECACSETWARAILSVLCCVQVPAALFIDTIQFLPKGLWFSLDIVTMFCLHSTNHRFQANFIPRRPFDCCFNFLATLCVSCLVSVCAQGLVVPLPLELGGRWRRVWAPLSTNAGVVVLLWG